VPEAEADEGPSAAPLATGLATGAGTAAAGVADGVVAATEVGNAIGALEMATATVEDAKNSAPVVEDDGTMTESIMLLVLVAKVVVESVVPEGAGANADI